MIKGFVEALRPFQVRGWVSDQQAPDMRLRVRVTVDGRTIGMADADLFRDDLLEARVGDGKYGFVVNVTETLPLDRPLSILVEALSEDDHAEPLAAISGLVVDPVEVHVARSSSETTITGFFAVTPAQVTGWAYDSARPDQHLEVVFEVEGRRIGQILANRFKDDLVLAGVGTGDHGFILDAPASEQPLRPEATAAFALSPGGRKVPLGVAVRSSASAPEQRGPTFPGLYVDPDQHPVIVLGAARSGTSAIAQALIGSGSYAGFEEGHLLDLLTPLMRVTSQFYEGRSEEWTVGRSTHLRAVPQSFMEQGLKHIILETARVTFPDGRWLDKTPRAGMVAAAPLLRAIWPNAKFIYMRRRAVENLDSRNRKFPGLDFEAQCQEWSLSIRTWYAVADALAGSAMEIDQVYMAAHPEHVASALGAFLGLEPNVVGRVGKALTFDRPERTASAFGAVTDVTALGWPARQVEIFKAMCGPAMRQAGYSEGATYFLDNGLENGLIQR